jgi:hypothetical protein
MYASAVSVTMPVIPGLANVDVTIAVVPGTIESANAGQLVLANVCNNSWVDPGNPLALPIAAIKLASNGVDSYASTVAVKFALTL